MGDSSGTSLRCDNALAEGGVKATPCPQPLRPAWLQRSVETHPDGSGMTSRRPPCRGVSEAEETLARPLPPAVTLLPPPAPTTTAPPCATDPPEPPPRRRGAFPRTVPACRF